MDKLFFERLAQERVDQVQITKWFALQQEYAESKKRVIDTIYKSCLENIPLLDPGIRQYNVPNVTVPCTIEMQHILQAESRPFRVTITKDGNIILSW